MKLFVTGASGWIGSATVTDLVAGGHEVVGMVRSDAAAAAVEALGAHAYRGDLGDLDSLRAGAADSDGVIHLGYNHDFSRMEAAAHTDRDAIATFGEVLGGSDRPLIIASGTLGLAPGRIGTERDMPDAAVHPRTANAAATLALADRGVRSIVVRFAPTVHGDGDHGFVAALVAIARDAGVSAYIADGDNRWPAVHRFDAAHLVRLAAENAPARSVLHGVAEDGIPTRVIAEAIGRNLGLPVQSISPDQAPQHFTWLAGFFGADAPASNTITREVLGWEPVRQGLVADLDAGYYTDSH